MNSIDEHSIEIDADPKTVWSALETTLDGMGMATYSRLVGCEDTATTGPRPFAEGSTIPGFHVVAAHQNKELTLEGRHRFSTYALTFRLTSTGSNQTRLSAQSRASFPGIAGGIYRALVIGTGGHAFSVRRLLSTIKKASAQE